jgi:hypothetical protein
MCTVNRLAVHERTAPDNALDSTGLTLTNRLLRDATLAEGTVEPDAADATFRALPHQFQRHLGTRDDDDTVDVARY